MQARTAHYMPTSLLDSQLDDLEPLGEDEVGIALDIGLAPRAIVDEILHTKAR
jgi:gluconate kinase